MGKRKTPRAVHDSIDSSGDPIPQFEKPRPQFTGWFIPAEIVFQFQDGSISAKEMLLLATIDSLCNHRSGDGCFASNDWLAKSCRMSHKNSVSRMLTKLAHRGFVTQKTKLGRRYLKTNWKAAQSRTKSGSTKSLGKLNRGKPKRLGG